MPVTVGDITGFCNIEEKLPGPVHDQLLALLELALNVIAEPGQTGLLFVAPVDDGTGLTVTAVV